MKGILKIGLRNLYRYKRRTILSSLIIMLGLFYSDFVYWGCCHHLKKP